VEAPDAVSVVEEPVQMEVPAEEASAIVGRAFTATVVVAAVADGQPLFTAYTEYTPAAAGCALVIVGFCSVDEKTPGPAHR